MMVDTSEHSDTIIVVIVNIVEANWVANQILIKDNFSWSNEQLYPLGSVLFRLTIDFDITDMRE